MMLSATVGWLTFNDSIGCVLILLQADEAIVVLVMVAPVVINIIENSVPTNTKNLVMCIMHV